MKGAAMVIGIVVSIAGVIFGQESKPPVTYTVRVGYLPATHDSLLFIAKYHRLFPENLDVTLVPYTSSSVILTDMRGEQVDIGIPGVAAPVKFIAGGAPFQIIGGAAQESAAVVVRPEFSKRFLSSKLTLTDKMRLFSHMKVGSVKLSTGDALFRKAIRDSQVEAVDLNDSYRDPKVLLNDLKGEKLDAAVLWSPHMTLAEQGGMSIVLWLGEVLPNHVCCRQVVRTEYLQKQREAVVLYLDGLIEAMIMYGDPKNKKQVIDAVANWATTTDRTIIEKELYGERRTKVSVDLNPAGTKQYLDAMSASKIINSNDCVTVLNHMNDSCLLEAYVRHGLSQEDARRAVYQGFEAVKGKLLARSYKWP